MQKARSQQSFLQPNLFKLWFNTWHLDGKMRLKLIILMLVLLALLSFVSACANTSLKGKALSDVELKELYPCTGVSCSVNEVCNAGKCACSDDFKRCPGQDSCISKQNCCSDSDCSFGNSCIDNACKFSCTNVEPESNKVCDPAVEDIVCLPGHKWCDEQLKCIPEDHCCTRFDCSRDHRCTQSSWSAEICLEDNMKNCKVLNEGEEKLFKAGNSEATIKLVKTFYDRKATLLIDSKELEILRGESRTLDDKTLFLAALKDYGGACLKK